MPEQYIGTKFTTIFLNRTPPVDDRIKRLIYWGRKLALIGLTPAYDFGAAGNLSVRTAIGFIITGTGKDLGNLKETDFVEVCKCDYDKREVSAFGNIEPSSEAMLHDAIYQRRPEVNAIFHVHDEYAVKNCDAIGLRCTVNEKPYGTKELVDEVVNVLSDNDYLVIKNHGVISLAAVIDDAGERIIEINKRVKLE